MLTLLRADKTRLAPGELLIAGQFVPDGVGSKFFLVAFNPTSGKSAALGEFEMEGAASDEELVHDLNDAFGTEHEFDEGDEEGMSAVIHEQGVSIEL